MTFSFSRGLHVATITKAFYNIEPQNTFQTPQHMAKYSRSLSTFTTIQEGNAPMMGHIKGFFFIPAGVPKDGDS